MLTSRGKPKAVLISVEAFERLRQMPRQDDRWAAWLAESDALAADILKRRGGWPLDMDAALAADRAELRRAMRQTRVIDASFAIKTVLPGPLQTPLRSLMTQWMRDGDTIYAPALWRYETTSTLTKLVHFKDLCYE